MKDLVKCLMNNFSWGQTDEEISSGSLHEAGCRDRGEMVGNPQVSNRIRSGSSRRAITV